jgi:hypothetical protein
MRNTRLEKRLNGSNWAYTGSLAMKIHANRLGINFPENRVIGNINIAAKEPLLLVPSIAQNGWYLLNAPERKRTMFGHPNGRTLDLFPANGRLAPNFSHVKKYKGYPPVMNLKSLLNQKRLANNNSAKLVINTKFLEFLMKHNSPRKASPVKKRRNINMKPKRLL